MRLPWQRLAREHPAFFELRSGIVGAGGTRFRTTEALLREYAAPVLDAVGLGELVRQAELWVRSPVVIGVFSLALALAAFPWWAAMLAAFLALALWGVVAPSLATTRGSGLLRVLDHPIVQAIAYVVTLSALASQGNVSAVWSGLAGFIALRLGLVGIALAPALERVHAAMYPLPLADQTLRSLILRSAIRRGIALPGMAEMEARARSFWRR
jgi:hypothetical protein